MNAGGLRSPALASVERLDRWVTKYGWEGFDPHDVKGTPLFMYLLRPDAGIAVKILRRPLLFGETLFPRLTRRLLGVKPTVNAKGMALFARGYLQLWQATADDTYKAKAIGCLDWLEIHTSVGYDTPCWGYPFDWQSGVMTPAGTPACVVTSAVADAFWSAWQTIGDPRYLEMCEGACRFFLTHLNRDEMADGTVCFSYTPVDDFHVHNANLLIAELLVRIGKETRRDDWQKIGIRAGLYALAEQNSDGSLYYWGRVQNHFNPNRVDHYHSGFEIRCLYGIATLTDSGDFRRAAERYYEFYLTNLLEERGGLVAPKMHPRSFYPINIHSCAEALLLNATLAPDFPEAERLLDPLVRWVTSEMQSPDGSFAYMIKRVMGWEVKATIPYLRWGQAWMLLALSQCVLLDAESAGLPELLQRGVE